MAPITSNTRLRRYQVPANFPVSERSVIRINPAPKSVEKMGRNF
jgi:hypothetical protein